MRLGSAKVAAALCAAAALLTAGEAMAADMPAYYSPETAPAPADAPLEFGTGWYLRGDAAFGPEDKPKLSVLSNVPRFDRKGSDLGYAFGGGAGYKFNDYLRADVTADYLDPFHYTAEIPCGGTCLAGRRESMSRWDGLVNGYVDLGTWFGLTPYLGAGAGVGEVHQTGTLATAAVSERSDYRFAWAAMAGVSYTVAPHMLVDVGYRYLDLGRTTFQLFPAAGVARSLSSQQVRLGIRYMID